MALKPTIYRFTVALSDMDRNYYDELALTIARHPSETAERMMVRMLAFCLNADEALTFTRGLSENDEPDLWRHDLDGTIAQWIEVGEPSAERLRKVARLGGRVLVYTFNSKSETWWAQTAGEIAGLPIDVYRFSWELVQKLTSLAERTMQMSVTISDGSMYVATRLGEIEVMPERLDV